MNKTNHWATFNYLEFQLPEECVSDCSASGSVDQAVEFWQKELKLGLDRVKMIKELREYGAWDDKELNDMDNAGLEQKMIWLGACDISEREIR